MASGLTAPIYDGSDMSFENYVWRTARHFGLMVRMRDDMTAPIPEKFEPQTPFYDKQLARARARLPLVEAMTDEEAQAEADKEYKEIIAIYDRIDAERKEVEARYETMLKRVNAWEPPTENHTALRDLMLEQLIASIEFDTKPTSRMEVEHITGPEWRERTVRKLKSEIVSSEEQIAQENERVESFNTWLAQLRESLEGAPV